ncbi:MAG: hypothetical protein WDN26_06695 [Chitinophagaceae bacterium]
MSLLRYESQVRPPLVDGDKDYHQVTEDICRPVEAKPTMALDRIYYFGAVSHFLVSCPLRWR